MSLPMSRRPAAVEEELVAESCKIKRIKVDDLFKASFMEDMIYWYQTLAKSKKRKLTAWKLKNKAIQVLYRYKYDYTKLPKDWVLKLAEETDMKIYERVKKVKDFSFLEERGTIQVVIDPLSMRHNQKLPIAGPSNVIYTTSKTIPKEEEEDGGEGEGEDKKKSSSTAKPPKAGRSVKPIIDLTDDPPPVDWLESYHKGEHGRRELTVVPLERETVMFWDYEPRYVEPDKKDPEADGKPIKIDKQPVHSGDSFHWFDEYESEEDMWDGDWIVYT